MLPYFPKDEIKVGKKTQTLNIFSPERKEKIEQYNCLNMLNMIF